MVSHDWTQISLNGLLDRVPVSISYLRYGNSKNKLFFSKMIDHVMDLRDKITNPIISTFQKKIG